MTTLIQWFTGDSQTDGPDEEAAVDILAESRDALPAHGDGHAAQRRRPVRLGAHGRGREHRGRRQGGQGAESAAGEQKAGHGVRKKGNAALQQSCPKACLPASGSFPAGFLRTRVQR